MKLYEKYLIIEAFKDIGKLSPEELAKGQRLYPNDKDNFVQVDGRVFYTVITKIKQADLERFTAGEPSKGMERLHAYSVSEYNKMRCFLGKNNSSGYAITERDTLVSVFSSQQSSGDAIVADAVKNGADNLTCRVFMKNGKLEGPLLDLYTRHGFKLDKSINIGKFGKPHSIIKGIFYYPDKNGKIAKGDQIVALYMTR